MRWLRACWFVVSLIALLRPVGALASPGDSERAGANSASSDAIDRVTITLNPAHVTIEMTSGATCEPTLRRPFKLPSAGTYFGNKSPGSTLTVWLDGRRRWRITFLQPPPSSRRACAAVQRARGRFAVEVWNTPADAAAAHRTNGGAPVAQSGAGTASRSGSAGGVADATADNSTGELARVRARARAIARADRGGAALALAEAARKVNRGERITYAEALALVDAKLGDIAREQSRHSSRTDWEQWAQFLLANRDKLAGHVRVDRDAMSLQQVEKLLAEYKQRAQIIDPPTVTGTQLQSQLTSSLAVDPVLIESWNHLEPWERAMWKAYWKKLPDATQSDRAVRVRDLRMTQRVRFHIALQSSVRYMGEGFRDAAGALFDDSTFMAIVAGGVTIYAIAILLPEPLFSKATAAAITTFLLASSFTLSEIIDVVKAWFRLRKDAGRARSMTALDAAAHDFGRAIGGAGFRVLLTLFTYFAGRALPAPKVGAPVGPAGGAAVTSGGGGGGAAVAALPRVAFIGGTRLVVLENGAVIIAPAVMGAVTAGGASSGGGATSGDGSGSNAFKVPKPRVSGKAGAKNVPSWAKGRRPRVGESGKDFARRLMDERYGKGGWSDTGPRSEFSKIKKWADRSFQDP